MYPTVTVWQGGQLVSATSLPQFNATSGALTQSLQITNNSDVTLIFKAEKATAVTILPRYRLTSPIPDNSQYNLSMAPGSASTADTTQYVTVTEAPDPDVFSLEPLNTDVTVVGGSVTVTGTANVNVTNTPAVTVTGTPNVNVANTPAVTVSGGVNVANITAGTVDVQNVTNGILTAGGGLLSLGNQNCGSTPVTVTVTITSLVRAIIIVSPPIVDGGQEWSIKVNSHASGPSFPTLNEVVQGNTVHVAYANAAFDTQWDITIFNVNAGVAGTQNYAQFYADTALPITDIVRAGQQAMSDSIPVAIAWDQTIGPRRPYDSVGVSAPGVGVLASLVFPAVSNRRYVLDYASWNLDTTATAPGGAGSGFDCIVLDGGTVIFQTSLVMSPTAAWTSLRSEVGPNLGLRNTRGASMTVQFSVAFANVFQRISAYAYLLPAGQ